MGIASQFSLEAHLWAYCLGICMSDMKVPLRLPQKKVVKAVEGISHFGATSVV